MKRKRRYLIAVAVSLAVMLAALVYAASVRRYSADTRNTITTGGIHIRLNETTLIDTATGKPAVIDPATGEAADSGVSTAEADFPADSAGGVANVLPGQAYAKRVSVTNRSAGQDAWVRVRVEKAFLNADGSAFAGDPAALVLLGLNEADWSYDGGYYYYRHALSPGETTAALFTGVLLDGETLDGRYSGVKAAVSVTAHAVQVKNNADSAEAALGWPS